MKPLKVKIVTPNDLLTAGHSVPLRCDAWGSYPPAKIVWLLDGEPIRNGDVTTSTAGQDGNVTTSILTLKVVAENDGAEVACRATNPWFSTGALQDKRVINVACKWERNATHSGLLQTRSLSFSFHPLQIPPPSPCTWPMRIRVAW